MAAWRFSRCRDDRACHPHRPPLRSSAAGAASRHVAALDSVLAWFRRCGARSRPGWWYPAMVDSPITGCPPCLTESPDGHAITVDSSRVVGHQSRSRHRSSPVGHRKGGVARPGLEPQPPDKPNLSPPGGNRPRSDCSESPGVGVDHQPASRSAIGISMNDLAIGARKGFDGHSGESHHPPTD